MATTKSESNKMSASVGNSMTNFQKDEWSGKTTVSDLQDSYVNENLASNSQYPMQQATKKLDSIAGLSTIPISSTAFSSLSKHTGLKTDFVTSEAKPDATTGTNQDNIGIPSIEISKTESSPIDLTPTQTLTKFSSDTIDTSLSKNVQKSLTVLNLKQNKTVSSSDVPDLSLKSDSSSKSHSSSSRYSISDSVTYGEKSAVTPSSFPFTDNKQIDLVYSSTASKTNYVPEVSQIDNGTDFIAPSSTPNIKTSSKPSFDMSASEFYSQFHSHSIAFPDFHGLSGETIQTVSPTATMATASVPVIGPRISSSRPPPPAVIPPGPLSTPSGDGNGTSVSSTETPALFANNYPLVIGVALCGAGVIIFLLILIVICCRKKKPKAEKHPHAQMQDLWVDTHGGEIPLPSTGFDSVPTFESVSDVGPINDNKVAKINESKSGSVQNQVKVIHPFKPTVEGQLEIKRDDIITVIQRDANGWWKGKLDDRIGWFPGSFVKEIDTDSGKKTDSNTPKDTTAVSSFLLSKDKKKVPPVPTRGDYNVHRYSDSRLPQKLALGKEVPIPKVPEPPQQNSEVKIDLEVLSPKPDTFDHNIEGRKFKALYSYVSNFKEELDMVAGEIITGIEKDRNGWMKGRKKSGEEGWIPSVYMEEIASSPRPTRQIYEQLHCNQSPGTSQDLLGIVHKATCPYAAERPEDLSFDTGDTIVVFDTLENGWWLGCRGEEVGWFPGSYVELVEEEIPEVVVKPPSSDKDRNPVITNSTFDDHIKSLPLKSDSVLSQTSDNNLPISPLKSDISELSAYKSDDEQSVSSGSTIDSKKSAGSRPKPARKAPAPPTESVKGLAGSKIPRFGNITPQPGKKELLPISPINTTLSTSTVDSERDTESVFSVSEMSKSELANDSKMLNSPAQTEKSLPTEKPELPKRFIKPKLIKIPRKSKSQQYINNRYSQKTKPPPPPRPDPPKYLPRSSAENNVQNKEKPASLKEPPVAPDSKPRSKIPKLSRDDSSDNPNVQINIVQDNTDKKIKDAYKESFGKNNSDSFNISGISSFSSDLSFDNDENNAKRYSSFKAPPANTDAGMASKQFPTNANTSSKELFSVPKSNQIKSEDGMDLDRTREGNLQNDQINFRNANIVNDVPEMKNETSDSVTKATKTSRIPKLPRQTSQTSGTGPQEKRVDDLEMNLDPDGSESQRQTGIPSISKIGKPNLNSKIDQSKTGLQSSVGDSAENSYENKSEKQEPLPSPKKPSRIPQSPKQSRLPMFNKDNKKRDKSVEKFEDSKKREKSVEKLDRKKQEMQREASPSAQKPPVAPKPKFIPVPKVYHRDMREGLEAQIDSSADELFENDDVSVNEQSNRQKDISPLDSGGASFEPEVPPYSETSSYPGKDSGRPHETPVEIKSHIPVTSKSAKKSPTLKSKSSQIPLSAGKKPVAKKRNKSSPSNHDTPGDTEMPTNGKTSRSGSLSDDTSSGKTKPPRPDKPPSRSGSQSDDGFKPTKTKPSRPDKPPSRSGSQSDDGAQPPSKTKLNQREKTPEGNIKSKIPSKTAEKSPSRIPKSHHSQSVQGQNVSPERNSRSRIKKGSGIPLMKPTRPHPPKSPSPEVAEPLTQTNNDSRAAEQTVDRLPKMKKTLRRAIRSYHAQNDDELSFEEGSFIKEIEDTENTEETKWRVGMLADGTIGLFHISFVEDTPAQKQSVV